ATRQLSTSRVLVVGACREAALNPGAAGPGNALARTLGALARADAGRCVTLRGLGREDVARVAEGILARPVDESIVSRLMAKPSGNPLFLTQVLHVMRSEEWMKPTHSGSTSAMLDAGGMREAIGLHLEDLPPEVRRTLVVATVFGVEFALGPLAAAC